MRIGILTLPLHTNYGGILQAYALQTVLKGMGHEVTLIDKGWPPHYTLRQQILNICRGCVRKIFKRHKGLRWHWIFFQNAEIIKEHSETFKFIHKYIHRIVQPDLYKIKETDFDAFVVGSDQIWREHHYRPIENAYLDFTSTWNVKRIAYAASFGTDCWEYTAEQTSRCGELLKHFDAASVREKTGVSLCNKYFHCEVSHVLDPTFLLMPKDYIERLNLKNIPQSSGNFLVYILDMTEEKQKIVDYISETYNIVPFIVNSKCEDKSFPLQERIQPSVEKWLRGFYDAEMVFTDSFHACAFSINFNKPFFVYGNKKRGMSRFESLLSSFGLENRLVTGFADITGNIRKTINWENVNMILADKRNTSMGFLDSVLQKHYNE